MIIYLFQFYQSYLEYSIKNTEAILRFIVKLQSFIRGYNMRKLIKVRKGRKIKLSTNEINMQEYETDIDGADIPENDKIVKFLSLYYLFKNNKIIIYIA